MVSLWLERGDVSMLWSAHYADLTSRDVRATNGDSAMPADRLGFDVVLPILWRPAASYACEPRVPLSVI